MLLLLFCYLILLIARLLLVGFLRHSNLHKFFHFLRSLLWVLIISHHTVLFQICEPLVRSWNVLAQAQLRPHILSSPAFSLVQSAYRPFFSTKSASVLLTNDLLSA